MIVRRQLQDKQVVTASLRPRAVISVSVKQFGTDAEAVAVQLLNKARGGASGGELVRERYNMSRLRRGRREQQ